MSEIAYFLIGLFVGFSLCFIIMIAVMIRLFRKSI